MLSTALNQQGATPGGSPLYGSSSTNYSALTGQAGTSPISKALASFSMAPTPTGPVKKQVVTSPDGTVNEQHYDTSTSSPSTSSSTPTQASQVTPGSTITDTSGNQGVANFNPYTGQPYSSSTTSSAPTSTTPTYSGLIGQGATASQNAATAGAQNYNTANTGLINTSQGNIPIGQNSQEIASQAGNEISQIGKQGAAGEAGYLTTGTSPVGEGNAAILGQTTAAEQQAVAQGAQTALLGNAQALTAQNQAEQGYGQAGQLGISGQQTGITGLGTNTGFLSPVPQFGVLTSPTTGQSVSPDGGMAAAVQGGKILGAQQGATTAAATPGSISSQQSTQVANYQSALQQGQNLASQATDLVNAFGLNPSELNAANGAIQKIALNTSDPHYQELNNYLNDISSRYSQILTPPGGTSTDMTRSVASGMLNSLASGKSMQEVLSSLDNQAQAVIAGVPTGGNSTTSNSNGGSSSTSGFGWNG